MLSPLKLAKELEAAIIGIISKFDIDTMPLEQRMRTSDLRRLATDIRLDARDYDFAETRAEQVTSGREARQRLEKLQHDIAAAGSGGVFSAVEVAHLSAHIQQLISRLV